MTLSALRELLEYRPDCAECEIGSAFDRRKVAFAIADLRGLCF